MKKRFLSVLISLSVIISSISVFTVSADANFSDLTSDHWAYDSIMKLVSQGTVDGFSDGTFKPSSTVSRAEFVKMLGKSNVRRSIDFSDVPADHWAYDYIMYSGLEGDSSNNFNPGSAITRNDVAVLLYTRYANNAEAVAPYCITGSCSNPSAAAWVYNCGIMIGDGKFNLRLDDSLTRAEAATLIIRAANIESVSQKDFINSFSDDTYKNIYNSSMLFSSPYNAEEGISYGELSLSALRFQFKQKEPPLGNYIYSKNFEGDYAREWNIMCNYVFDNSKFSCTEEEAGRNATVADALAMITYCIRNNPFVKCGLEVNTDKIYPELANSEISGSYRDALSYAYNFGIALYAGAKINPEKTITKKELACIIMQYDLTFGTQIAYKCGYECTYEPSSVRNDFSSYPSNSDNFAVILEDVPNLVYETPYDSDGIAGECKKVTDRVNSISSVFYSSLADICSYAYSYGLEIYITMYPSLIAKSENGYIYRVKLNVQNAPSGASLSDVLPLNSGVEDIVLNSGDEYYIDILTNEPLKNIFFNTDAMTIGKIIR